jgi:FkbM family methyltransferase
MKKFLKNILPAKLIMHLSETKLKYFPSEEQKKDIQYKKEAAIKCAAFYASIVNAGELCFDVGANMGNRIDPLLQAGAKVLAVEPQRSCYKHLRHKYGNSIILITKGLSNVEGIKKFYISDSSTISSFSEEWISAVKTGRFKQHSWNKVEEIEMTTLDKLIETYGVPVFIKIDVEGYELEVLKGLNSRVKLISFEYAAPEHSEVAIACISYIQKIDSNSEYNYSVGESFELALDPWITADQMKDHIRSKQFADSDFGDIYVRMK